MGNCVQTESSTDHFSWCTQIEDLRFIYLQECSRVVVPKSPGIEGLRGELKFKPDKSKRYAYLENVSTNEQWVSKV